MDALPSISDDRMHEALAATERYTVVLLRPGPHYGEPGSDAIIWEHGRRNFALRDAGTLAVVCPIGDGSDIAGLGIFAADLAETESIMAGDPAVLAGVLTFDAHPARGFPGDALPARSSPA